MRRRGASAARARDKPRGARAGEKPRAPLNSEGAGAQIIVEEISERKARNTREDDMAWRAKYRKALRETHHRGKLVRNGVAARMSPNAQMLMKAPLTHAVEAEVAGNAEMLWPAGPCVAAMLSRGVEREAASAPRGGMLGG